MDERKDEEARLIEQHPQKKPYQKPVLIRLGSLRELTLMNGNHGNWDGGLMGKTKTGRGGHYGR